MFGREYRLARKPESRKATAERIMPRMVSKSRPPRKMLRTSAALSSALY